ncbi:hypothetical protein [Gottfriedia acidiceleris]|uniref:Uncharacterized protein n=1 Tax=Gottfriedia acidiceleris TaxID=371036 RepID=A0ABY4JUZ2_9BACI|nr:hypothetical protein [Gottfriedia acidiceleris]UPM56135.1 hypothetical protein MY490_09995 [Gottfriedia acidiceleris]
MTKCSCCCTSLIACNISVFDQQERIKYDELRKELTTNVKVEKTNSGYTFIYPNHSSILLKIVEWVSFENRCCPFINFSLHVSGESDVVKLDLTGNEATIELLKVEFNLS